MIWCVDDDNTIRDIEVYTLTQTGFDAKGFADGISMLEALKTEKPELIVLDIMLPGKDGVDVLKEIRNNPETRKIPVIMATAKGTEMDKIQQFCDDCLHQAQARQLQTSTAYQAYRGWCQDVGDRYPVTANRFYGEMKKRFPVRKTKACNVYDNLELTEQGERGFELERRRSGRS